ncbi:lactoylglutathione lyase-like lyase [Frankia casuarinae]|nr:lactoylglutathione lyase-like lyase [Frankia sp. CcI6]EYT92278.1 lactoylglutathione lyase-like lyase [Frankia casuarinae]KDA42460.1 lactoylglutathione lyase-like lyase [Frankia sp. BMG5.23]KEZ38031.1 methylmalonyl-CoA epimerase [Frankia sp. CeD]KFB06483.1 methylmalonyl-CoA epimerase [Frankia sp. Allo2]
MMETIIQNREDWIRTTPDPASSSVRTTPHSPACALLAARVIEEMLGELTFHHLGILVADLDAARERYAVSLGVDAWESRVVSGPAVWRDRPIMIEDVRIAFGRFGSSLVELVEPGERPWTGREILDQRGEGLFSIGYEVDDLPACLHRAVAAGCLVEQLRPDARNPRRAYLDAGSGLLIELIPGGAGQNGW